MQEKVSQADVIANLAAQAEGQGVDLSHSDLSTIAWEGLDASGATIAMSLFRGARFAAPQALNGCTWIGNRLDNCRRKDCFADRVGHSVAFRTTSKYRSVALVGSNNASSSSSEQTSGYLALSFR